MRRPGRVRDWWRKFSISKEDLRKAQHAIERSAELMAHVREEGGLGLVGGFGLALRDGEFGGALIDQARPESRSILRTDWPSRELMSNPRKLVAIAMDPSPRFTASFTRDLLVHVSKAPVTRRKV